MGKFNLKLVTLMALFMTLGTQSAWAQQQATCYQVSVCPTNNASYTGFLGSASCYTHCPGATCQSLYTFDGSTTNYAQASQCQSALASNNGTPSSNSTTTVASSNQSTGQYTMPDNEEGSFWNNNSGTIQSPLSANNSFWSNNGGTVQSPLGSNNSFWTNNGGTIVPASTNFWSNNGGTVQSPLGANNNFWNNNTANVPSPLGTNTNFWSNNGGTIQSPLGSNSNTNTDATNNSLPTNAPQATLQDPDQKNWWGRTVDNVKCAFGNCPSDQKQISQNAWSDSNNPSVTGVAAPTAPATNSIIAGNGNVNNATDWGNCPPPLLCAGNSAGNNNPGDARQAAAGGGAVPPMLAPPDAQKGMDIPGVGTSEVPASVTAGATTAGVTAAATAPSTPQDTVIIDKSVKVYDPSGNLKASYTEGFTGDADQANKYVGGGNGGSGGGNNNNNGGNSGNGNGGSGNGTKFDGSAFNQPDLDNNSAAAAHDAAEQKLNHDQGLLADTKSDIKDDKVALDKADDDSAAATQAQNDLQDDKDDKKQNKKDIRDDKRAEKKARGAADQEAHANAIKQGHNGNYVAGEYGTASIETTKVLNVGVDTVAKISESVADSSMQNNNANINSDLLAKGMTATQAQALEAQAKEAEGAATTVGKLAFAETVLGAIKGVRIFSHTQAQQKVGAIAGRADTEINQEAAKLNQELTACKIKNENARIYNDGPDGATRCQDIYNAKLAALNAERKNVNQNATGEREAQNQAAIQQGIEVAKTEAQAGLMYAKQHQLDLTAKKIRETEADLAETPTNWQLNINPPAANLDGTPLTQPTPDVGAITASDTPSAGFDPGLNSFNPNAGAGDVNGPAAAPFNQMAAAAPAGAALPNGNVGGTSSKGDDAAKPDNSASKIQVGSYSGTDPGGSKFSRSSGSAGVGSDPSFADLLKKFLPGDDDKKDGKTKDLASEDRSPASDSAAVLGRNTNIFDEIHKRYEKKHGEGAILFLGSDQG